MKSIVDYEAAPLHLTEAHFIHSLMGAYDSDLHMFTFGSLALARVADTEIKRREVLEKEFDSDHVR